MGMLRWFGSTPERCSGKCSTLERCSGKYMRPRNSVPGYKQKKPLLGEAAPMLWSDVNRSGNA